MIAFLKRLFGADRPVYKTAAPMVHVDISAETAARLMAVHALNTTPLQSKRRRR